MPATKVNLSQMVDLALGSPEVGSVNFNVLHTLLHAMLKRLNIVDVTADISDFDRDFLSASKARELSVLSDVDSGRGSEVGVDDTFSERSSSLATPSTGRKTPYHHLEIKVAKLQEQLDNITSVPSNKHLFDKTKTQYEEKPIGEMWLNMQLMSRVETNEKGIAKCMSMIEDMMREMQALKDANKNLMDKVKGLNIDDLMKRLKDLESKMNDMNDKFNLLPSPEDFAQFVTWAGLEDALQGIKKDWENLQQPDRVVIEMSSQTEAKRQHKPSRPTSSRPGTRMSSGSTGPSETLLEILEKLGSLSSSHDALTKRVEDLEAEMKNKLDKGALDNLNISSDLLEQLQQLKQEVDALAAAREKDSDALSRAQAAIAQLQAEVEKLHGTTKDILEENNNRAKEIEKLFAYCDKLQEVKADKEYVQAEVDVKADKRLLDNKVNHTLFDTTTNDIHKMIKEILEKLAGNEDAWNHRCKVMSDDIEGKLDRLELDPLKEWLESRLKALNDKLRKTNQAPVEWNEDDAAGIRRQLIQKFHCISCDRPVDIVPTGPVPSLPSHNGLHPTRSPRPYTTFELDQIRQHAKSYANAEISDYYATNRSCGGQHTTTFPQKRITKLSHLSHLFREEEPTTNIYPIYKEEVDVQGADGNIYKGRMERLEAKLPSVNQDRTPMHRRDKSPQPIRQQFTRVVRPASAKQIHSPRPPSGKSNSGGSPRPQSAHPSASQQEVPGAESSHTTPAPSQSPVPQEIISVDQAQQQSIEIPAES